MQILAFTELTNYHLYATTEMSVKAVKLVKDMSLKLNFYNNIEQRHPMRPNYEISMQLESMSVTASDYIFKTLMRLKDVVLEKLAPPPSEEAVAQPAVPGPDAEKPMKLEVASIVEEDKMEFDDALDMHLAASKAQGTIEHKTTLKKPEGLSINVIVSIGFVELNLLETVQPEDPDYDALSLDSVQHRDLLFVRIGDLSLNYQLDRRGTQTITMILNEFDVADTTKVLRADNT